jgi:hypothetical protein
MAMILITVQDLADGNVEVKMHAEPPVYSDQDSFTDAQRMAAVALTAIHGAIQDIGPKAAQSAIVVAGTNENAAQAKPRPKLVIAGADEMPL